MCDQTPRICLTIICVFWSNIRFDQIYESVGRLNEYSMTHMCDIQCLHMCV